MLSLIRLGKLAINGSKEVLMEIEKMAKRRFLPIIGSRKGQVLVNTVCKVKPKRVLEVGTLIGYSTILIGRELEDDCQLITIEIDEDEAKMAEENLRKAGLSRIVDVVIGDAIKVIPNLKGKFGVVFIDAEKSEYLDYLKLVEDKLHKGSVLVADHAGIFADQMADFLEMKTLAINF